MIILRLLLLGGVVAIFSSSLSLPAFWVAKGNEPRQEYSGIKCLMLSPFGATNPAALANFLLPWWAYSLLRASRQREASVYFKPLGISLVALLLALTFLGQTKITVAERGGDISSIVGYGPGYYRWVTSIAVACAGTAVLALIQYFFAKREQPIDRGIAMKES
ncbi:MAG: hypothetical protein WD851_18135 [Pirellulales bacterium]